MMRLTKKANAPFFHPAYSIVTNVKDLKKISNRFNYPITMLQNLEQNSTTTNQPPFNSLPPPHLLLGYQYLMTVMNNYEFHRMITTRINYSESYTNYIKKLHWSTVMEGVQTVDTSYFQMNMDSSFAEQFNHIQQGILRNRIQNDIRLLENRRQLNIAGRGITDHHFHITKIKNTHLKFNLSEFIRNSLPYLSSVLISDLNLTKSNDYRKDLHNLTRLIMAITHYLYFIKSNKNHNEPMLILPCDTVWINKFIDKFVNCSIKPTFGGSGLDDSAMNDNCDYLQCYLLACSARNITNCNEYLDKVGGAMRLRSGTVINAPFRLRPRVNQRAQTAQTNIPFSDYDLLPVVRRRRDRRPAPYKAPSSSTSTQDETVEEPPPSYRELFGDDVTIHGYQSLEEDRIRRRQMENLPLEQPDLEQPGSSRPRPLTRQPIRETVIDQIQLPRPDTLSIETPPSSFADTPIPRYGRDRSGQTVEVDFDEILRTLFMGVQNLTNTLPPHISSSHIFNFTTELIDIMLNLRDQDQLSSVALRRITFYFFLLEHIASTLYYLRTYSTHNSLLNNHVQVQFGQVVLQGFNQGVNTFYRLFHSDHADPFRDLFNNILDFARQSILSTINLSEHPNQDEHDQVRDDLMRSLGDIEGSERQEEIIAAIMNDPRNIEEMRITIKIKINGDVVISQNVDICTNTNAVFRPNR